ncbi:ketopantoate reductase [Acetobacter tropicalis NRIC 0312]|uniref:2-dehydropantoate 2-reductase n=1 Tax=Acetobacter tropicalis TaxID=104102 RepID=A0A511FRA5_9PROT|nr:2-dehydropantoate 2-reductase [Acetobacter tropicalis]KXV50755.1 hypothetical protein AD944_04165 [Acetobacter tropicalis]GAL96010.1 ketopantoate reductase ApbA/PanE [Acetobacter tropicalis]GBR68683.1 ketopantoate reductase [Acetobacter tropicalis NRIC 0312]GEL51464.1 2-dehydropantoate 2-reductase [Acetobacter tropicalis]
MVEAPKICVAGIGALGGTFAAMLAHSGANVSVVARGATLQAIRARGLELQGPAGTFCTPVAAAERAPDTRQDLLVLAVKAHQLATLVPLVKATVDAGTPVLPIVNGIPWWMTVDGPFESAHETVDPGSVLTAAFPAAQVIGCVAYAFASMPLPAVVRSDRQPKLVLGRAAQQGRIDAGLAQIGNMLSTAGIAVELSTDIRQPIWTKLAFNLATNPLSVLCEATLEKMGTAEDSRAVISDVLAEVRAVGAACGLTGLPPTSALLDVIASAGPHETSMLQDFRAGRLLELDAMGEAVTSLAGAYGVPTPTINTLVRLTRFKAAQCR